MYLYLLPWLQQQAAACTVYCATATELEGVGGLYFNNCCICQPSDEALNEASITKLWKLSEKMITDRIKQWEKKATCDPYKTEQFQEH